MEENVLISPMQIKKSEKTVTTYGEFYKAEIFIIENGKIEDMTAEGSGYLTQGDCFTNDYKDLLKNYVRLTNFKCGRTTEPVYLFSINTDIFINIISNFQVKIKNEKIKHIASIPIFSIIIYLII